MAGERFAIIANQGFALLNFRRDLMLDMVAKGVKVSALAPSLSDEHRAVLRAVGIEPVDYSLSRSGLNPFTELADFIALVRLLRTHGFDGVLSIAIKPVIYGSLAAWLAGVPRRYALITGLGYAFGRPERRSFRQWLIGAAARIMARAALARVNGVFLQNPDDVRDLVDARIVTASKVLAVAGTGVDLEQWVALPPVTAPLTFTLAARLIREKGIEDFVEAARRIRRDDPQARFVLLGGIDDNPGAIGRQEVQSWVDEGVVEWPGHVDVRRWLAETSVFVLPSVYREGVPRSTQEAMAMGRPIITTDAPGCRETVVDGQNGFLVPPGDVAALAAAMQRFVGMPDLVARMGRESRLLAEARFDVRKINRTLIEAMRL